MTNSVNQKQNAFKVASITTIVVGIVLLVYMVMMESEPGILPIILMTLGTISYIFVEVKTNKASNKYLRGISNKMNKRLFIILMGVTILLIVPLVLQITIGTGVDGQGFNWKLNDFLIFGFLLFSTGLLCEFVLRKVTSFKKSILLCGVILLLLLLIWAELAVGIFNISGFSGS